MSSPSEKKPSFLDEEEDYYAVVERHFVNLRGSPLFITPRDWQLIHAWRQMQIPISVVREGLDHAFEKRKSTRPVRSLSYCRQSVETTYRRHLEALTGSYQKENGPEELVTVQQFLLELASQLDKLSHTHKTSRPKLSEVTAGSAQKLSIIATGQVESDRFGDVEDELQQLDEELLEIAEDSMDEDERRSCHDEAEKALESYRVRMPEDVYASAFESAYRKRVRAHLGLPALSLFYI